MGVPPGWVAGWSGPSGHLRMMDCDPHPPCWRDDPQNVLAFCLAFLAQTRPDLAAVAEAWDTLPEALRSGIVAMVKASGGCG